MPASRLALLVLAPLLAPLAAAHSSHPGCGPGATEGTPLLNAHVDVWTDGCLGAALLLNDVECGSFPHAHLPPGVLRVEAHAFALHGEGCGSGVLLQP